MVNVNAWALYINIHQKGDADHDRPEIRGEHTLISMPHHTVQAPNTCRLEVTVAINAEQPLNASNSEQVAKKSK